MRKQLTFTCMLPAFFFMLILTSCRERDENEADQSTNTLQSATVNTNTPTLFTLLSPAQTGISFSNQLSEGLNTNILMYEYFYNGGGVATGDLNGDGLLDVYFTSNMGANALYLNQGNLQFIDISDKSGARGRNGPWKTGVTMADVNGDGKLDIYLCYSGAMPDPKRANQLFINQGNNDENIPIFKEQGEKYGLNSTAFSNQGFFFDFDHDNDLDMILLNHNPKSLPVLNETLSRRSMKEDDPLRGLRLFERDQQTFTDITQKAGIVGSGLSYGLGVAISDLNGDGWLDFYVSNDYDIPDYLYLNNQDGTFTNALKESIGHNSHFSMGNDIGDMNNDGLPDIITLDMLPEDNRRQKLLMSPDNYAKFDLSLRSGFHYQYMRNMLQLNNGNGTFSEIGQLAGISNTDWSWAALLADYDNDGWKDLYITNGYFRDYTNLDFINYMDSYVQARGRLVRQDVVEIIKEMPATNVVNYIFSNQQGQRFINLTREWGLDRPSNSNGAAHADLDNDGDLDIIVSNINQAAFLYENKAESLSNHHYLQIKLAGEGGNTYGIGAKVELRTKGQKQILEQIPTRGYLSSVSPILHFGLGTQSIIDSLMVYWPSGKKQLLTQINSDQQLILSEKEASSQSFPEQQNEAVFVEKSAPISHTHPKHNLNDFDRQPLLINGLSYDGPCMIKGDVNGDQKEDIFIGGAANQAAKLYIQRDNGNFTLSNQPTFETNRSSEDVDAVLLDIDNDGDEDLYVASGGYHLFQAQDALLQDRLYINDGTGNFQLMPEALPDMKVSSSSIAAHDINDDGFIDLFVGGRLVPGQYPEIPLSYILVNDARGQFSDQTESIAPGLRQPGMVTDAEWVDLNGDELKELVIVGEWMAVCVYEKDGSQYKDRTSQYFETKYRGMWNHIGLMDVNEDGRIDLMLGNIGQNVQFQVSEEEPAELYVNDFDDNGSIDPIFCFYIQGTTYPYLTRDELARQIASTKARFTSYKSYAGASLYDIFEPSQIESASKLEMNEQQTTLFIQRENGHFQKMPLPLEAQYAPVYTITSLDHNGDGHLDVLLCGNNDHAKLRLGKMDANYGILLEGNGKGIFQYVPQTQSGFRIKGDVRSTIKVNKWLFFGMNQGEIIAYQQSSQSAL